MDRRIELALVREILPNRGHTTVHFNNGSVACSCGMLRNKVFIPNLRDLKGVVYELPVNTQTLV